MKNTIGFLTVLMVISSVVFARRIDNPGSASGVAVIKSGTTFKLYYKNAEHSNVKVSIRDAKDNIVFSETLHNVNGFVRPYNFSTLSNGNYTIEVSDRNSTHTEAISIEKEELPAGTSARLFKVSGEQGKYLLTFANQSADDITVRIYDASNNVIYTEAASIESNFAKVYNLQKYSGKFTFEVTNGKGKVESISYK